MSIKVLREALTDPIVESRQANLADVVASYKTLTRANTELQATTGIDHFFANRQEFDEFCNILKSPVRETDSRQKREWGDFQTPPNLARQACAYLKAAGVAPNVIVEPTYGLGNFILAALETFPALDLIYGVEIQERYEWHLKIALLIKALLGQRVAAKIQLHRDSIFDHEFPTSVLDAPSILVLGNPPWVTSAALGVLDSANLPIKKNLKSLNGMDALTGKSNFDISEYILLRLLNLFSQRHGTMAMLCKTATAKNIIELLPRQRFAVSNIRTLTIDANREFNAAVDACLLVMELGAAVPSLTCQVGSLDNPKQIERVYGWINNNKFVSNVDAYKRYAALDGKSIFTWRQGIKHDCSPIMELDLIDGRLVNGNSEPVAVESDYIYPLLKSSDLQNFQSFQPRKQVIITQTKLGDATVQLRTHAPNLWKYLTTHETFFEKRKSSIYRNKPRFSIFGIGDYSFKPFKVAVSGLYKELNFCLVRPVDERPVMLDDTCYFLGFDNYLDALFIASVLNSSLVKQFLSSIVFRDAKRPYTKEALMRVDLATAAGYLTFADLQILWKKLDYHPDQMVSELDWLKFKNSISNSEIVGTDSTTIKAKNGQMQLL